MASARIVGLVLCLLTAGCVVTEYVAPRESPKAGTTPAGTVSGEPEVRQTQPSVSGSAGQGLTATEAPAARTEAPAPGAEAPKQKTTVSAPKTETPAARTDVPAVKTPAKAPAGPAPVKPPALDLGSLEKRLKETSAIGVFTKLTLKNQVDDLLSRFRAYYEGRAKTTLAELRQPYDLLILKVLALLQDGDPSLARAIADSREVMWGILADPTKFKAL